jgi:glutamate/tyrosine decarboxylase-like PLP-dependent enzyme
MSDDLLAETASLAAEWLASLASRPVARQIEPAEMRARLSAPLPDDGEDPRKVITELAAAMEPGLVATPGPRYFGFVTGGSLPAALAADWLVSAWDQNSAMQVMSPAVAAVEEVAAEWLLDVLGLPARAGVGFVTGAQMANFTCLAAGRDSLLAGAGWDVAADGLAGAPSLTVITGAQAHATIGKALRLLGLGPARARRVPADSEGRMIAAELRRELAGVTGPALVCAQAGEVNSGAIDPLDEIASLVRERPGTWLHVDGAFGLWAAASPALRPQVAGAGRADSWATDAHKWLNVPYDCGLAIVADPGALTAALGLSAAYLPASAARDALNPGARGVAAGPGAARLRRAALARPPRPGRTGGPLLRTGPAGRGRPGRRGIRRDPQRGHDQPGAVPRPGRGRRRRDPPGPAGRHLLAGRDFLAG